MARILRGFHSLTCQGFIQPPHRGKYSPPEKFYSTNQALLTLPPSEVVYHEIHVRALSERLRTVAQLFEC